MLISQGFFDNVISPSSNSSILLVGNYQQNNKISNDNRMLSKTDVSLINPSNEGSMTILEDSETSNIKTRYHNLESMQNIVERPENCFISPFHNEADHQTRNISTITGQQSDLKETAHLGHERPNREVVKQLSKAKKIRGLEIL